MTGAAKENAPLPAGAAGVVAELAGRRPDLRGATGGLAAAWRLIARTFEAGGILYLCGNGGSFADAVHIKGELGKRFGQARPLTDAGLMERLRTSELGRQLGERLEGGLPAVVLGESHSLRSAVDNDGEARFHFAQELHSLAAWVRGGALLGISTSGRAENVLAAMTLARAHGLGTISFTGPADSPLARLAEVDWRVPGATTAEIQENQAPLYHALCRMLEVHFFGGR